METSRIFVKGLPPNLTEADFRKHFSAKDREVTDVKLIPGRRIGYVGFKTAEDASKAIKYFNKTYIRMSKIAVEPAKAIADPSLLKKHTTARSFPSTDAPSHQHRNAPAHVEGGAGQSADAQHESKKRKRGDAPAEPLDPKLQEYLQVMDSSKGSGLLADHGYDSHTAAAAPQAANVVPEDESDDEYETIPSRKDKQRKLDDETALPISVHRDSTVPDQQQDSGDVRDTAAAAAAAASTAPPSADAMEGAQPTDTNATDDEWLRSRTNRLLDLADPDDLDLTAPPVATTGGSQAKEPARDETTEKSEAKSKDTAAAAPSENARPQETDAEKIARTARLFVRNLRFSATEDELREKFSSHGPVTEVHIPTDAKNKPKGYALVLFADPSDAVNAFQSLDKTDFQGRIMHIMGADAKRDEALDEFELSKLPLKKQNLIRKKNEASTSTFNWNSLYMNQDAVNESTAKRLNITKSELLDPTSSDAAVKQAIAETSVIQETKAYFAANGVDLDAFKSQKRGDTAILVKNFPHGTTLEELRTLFEASGPVLRVLMPPSGTIAIVQFAQPNHAKSAFGQLAYRRIKDSVLFLEKAPKDLFTGEAPVQAATTTTTKQTGVSKVNVNDLLSRDKNDADDDDDAEEGTPMETTSLFVRNLNFDTTTDGLAEAFGKFDGFVNARVKTKTDPKKPGQTLSMGFGFAEFRTKAEAKVALQQMDGKVLDGHTLAVKASHKGHDAAEERRREDQAKKKAGQRTKIIIKNLPFQASKKDIRTLFGTYGQLRSVRVPKKADYTARGFAFADFVTAREAENALNALKDTHLLGRRLVLDFAEAEAVDAEEEIEKMQKKVGRQVNKVAIQKLTGGGRRKVNIGDDAVDEEG